MQLVVFLRHKAECALTSRLEHCQLFQGLQRQGARSGGGLWRRRNFSVFSEISSVFLITRKKKSFSALVFVAIVSLLARASEAAFRRSFHALSLLFPRPSPKAPQARLARASRLALKLKKSASAFAPLLERSRGARASCAPLGAAAARLARVARKLAPSSAPARQASEAS